MATLPIALQLYTVRDALAKDYVGTLRGVAAAGYTAVELNRPEGMTTGALQALLADHGLRAVAAHIGFEEWDGDPAGSLAWASEIGCTFAICPHIPADRRADAAAYRALGDLLSRAGARAREHGLRFAYHNHAFEFTRFDGRTAFDILMDAADPDLVASEFDVYWAAYGGVDPVAAIRALGRRCPILHMKDMDAGPDRTFAEVGEGILDMPAIVAAGQEVGVEWYIVEQDVATKRTPLEAAALSLRNMRQRGWA